MIQIRYRVPVNYRPTLTELASLRSKWINGEKLPKNVRIDAIDWFSPERSQVSIRSELRKRKSFRTVPGIVARYAEERLTMCDYDRKKINPEQRVFRLARMLKIYPEWIELRRTARGWHMTIKWDHGLSPTAIVAIQSILGSDPFREAFNLARIRGANVAGLMRDPRWNLLFKEKIK